jgi:hypothetical protein
MMGKKVFFTELLLLSFAILAYNVFPAKSSDTEAIISITPETQTFYKPTFTVTVNVTNATNVYAWQIRINFNATILNCTGVYTPDDSIFKLEQLAGIHIDNDAGYLMMGYSRMGDVPGINGSDTLAVITFEIKATIEEGELPFNLTFDQNLTYLLNPALEEMPKTLVGGAYTYIKDTTPPTIISVTQSPSPDNVQEDQDVIVHVNVTDVVSGVKNVTLYYTTDSQTWSSISMMFNETSGLYEAKIDGRTAGAIVKYYITACDYAENVAETSQYTYTVIPEFTPMFLLTFMATALLLLVFALKVFRVKNPYQKH